MNLFIQIENGQPVNHPAFEENLIQVFGSVPEHWEPFVRVENPQVGVYQVLEGEEPSYQQIDGVWTDVWPLRDMTPEEIAAKQQTTKNQFFNRRQAENWLTWTLDEPTCTMVPPIPRSAPDESKLSQGIFTFWCGADNDWKDTPPYPQDGKEYQFDFLGWQWEEIPNV